MKKPGDRTVMQPSEALGINNHGEIVGSSDATNVILHAALWTPAHEQQEDNEDN